MRAVIPNKWGQVPIVCYQAACGPGRSALPVLQGRPHRYCLSGLDFYNLLVICANEPAIIKALYTATGCSVLFRSRFGQPQGMPKRAVE